MITLHISAFTWARAVQPRLRDHAGSGLGPTPAIGRWLAGIESRPAVRRGLEMPTV